MAVDFVAVGKYLVAEYETRVCDARQKSQRLTLPRVHSSLCFDVCILRIHSPWSIDGIRYNLVKKCALQSQPFSHLSEARHLEMVESALGAISGDAQRTSFHCFEMCWS